MLINNNNNLILKETYFERIERTVTDLETWNLQPNQEYWRAAYRRVTWHKPCGDLDIICIYILLNYKLMHLCIMN